MKGAASPCRTILIASSDPRRAWREPRPVPSFVSRWASPEDDPKKMSAKLRAADRSSSSAHLRARRAPPDSSLAQIRHLLPPLPAARRADEADLPLFLPIPLPGPMGRGLSALTASMDQLSEPPSEPF